MLALEEWIAQSDDDLEIWASVTVGFDDGKNLIVKLEYIDYDKKEYSYNRYAIVTLRSACQLAEKLRVSLTALPSALKKRYGCCLSDFLVPSDIVTCFKEVLDFMNDYGIRYKIS